MATEVIASFYEFKNLLVDLFTERISRQFDTCFKVLKETLEKKDAAAVTVVAQLENADQLQMEPKNDSSMKRYEGIRKETINDLVTVFDSELTQTLENFLNQKDVKEKLNFISESELNEELSGPTIEANHKVCQKFTADLEVLCQKLDKLFKIRTTQRDEVKTKLAELVNKRKKHSVLVLNVSLICIKTTAFLNSPILIYRNTVNSFSTMLKSKHQSPALLRQQLLTCTHIVYGQPYLYPYPSFK